MNYPERVAWCLIALLTAACSSAQTAPLPANGPMNLGQVQAFIVAGNVSLVAKDGTVSPLKRGQSFEEGNVIKAGPKSQALLVFSNGVALKVFENCQISIDEFKQAPFDEQAEGTFLRLGKDPSKSMVTLDLRNGLAQFRVQPLNKAAGSFFHINTPVGSFAVQGELFSISVRRNAAGQVTKVLGNSCVGTLSLIPSSLPSNATTATNQPIPIPASGQIQIQFSTDPIAGGIISNKVYGAGIPLKYSQEIIDAIWEPIATAKTVGSFGASPPKALPPTPPKGWPLADFDPDPVSPGLTK